MSGLALLLLIFIPAVEIYLFIEIGGAIGAGWTIVLIIVTAIWGASAMRRQGLAVLAEAQNAQARGNLPVAALAHGLLILIGGVMLVIPGFLTDAVGLILMLRWGRLLVIESVLGALMPALMRGFQARTFQEGSAPGFDKMPPPMPADRSADTIEGEYTVTDDTQLGDDDK